MDRTPFDPSALASSPEEALQIIQTAVFDLWDVVNNLTRLRPRQLNQYHVTIFGSSRIQPNTPFYNDVRRLAQELALLGCQIVTGGGPGLMQAANEGASLGDPDDPNASIGIRIALPFEQHANAFVGQVYEHKTFFTRLHHFIMISDAFLVVPGGIGTSLELFMVWQLLQVKQLYGTPFILVGKMWQDLVNWASEHMTKGEAELASPVDMTIPRCVETVEEAISLVREHYVRWEQDRKPSMPR